MEKKNNNEIDVPITMDKDPLLEYFVPPHTKISIPVTDETISLVVNDLKKMYQLCFVKNGPYFGAFAVAHPQIEDFRPYRIFVTSQKEIICNPVIINHTKTMVDSFEACMTFPHQKPINVPRWNKIEVDYQTVISDPEHPDDEYMVKLSEVKHKSLSGHWAKVFQHEVDHLNSLYIYPFDTQ